MNALYGTHFKSELKSCKRLVLEFYAVGRMASVRSNAHRSRTKWGPSIHQTGEDYEFSLVYRNTRGILAPYSNSPQTAKVKIAWGSPDNCVLGTAETDGVTEYFFRFSCRSDSVKFFLGSMNPLLEQVSPLGQRVQSMVTEGKLDLLADYFSLLNKAESFSKHHPGVFLKDGFRKDGQGIQEQDLVEKGGSGEHFRSFLTAAKASAHKCQDGGKTGEMSKRKAGEETRRVKKCKPTAEQRLCEEIGDQKGVEKKYSNSFIGSADVSLDLMEVDPVLKKKVRYFHVIGIKNEIMKRFDPSLLSITVRPKDMTAFNSQDLGNSRYYVVQGIHSFRALQEIEREGKLQELSTVKDGLVTVHVVNIEDKELVLYGNVRSNSLASVFVRKPQPQVGGSVMHALKLHGSHTYVIFVSRKYFYKPTAQAAGADPSRCNSTNRQNPPIQQNRHNSLTSNAISMPFKI